MWIFWISRNSFNRKLHHFFCQKNDENFGQHTKGNTQKSEYPGKQNNFENGYFLIVECV